MFGRKKPENESDKGGNDLGDDLAIPAKPAARPMPGPQPPARPTASAPIMPPRPAPEPARPTVELPRRPADLPAGAATAPMAPPTMPVPPPRPAEPELRKLIVGREISLSGEITSCDRLTVEGSVEANLTNCKDIDIAESGLFKGSATIDDAEIKGRFEGTLTVRKRLFIRATGKVMGTVRYGQLEIECGGHLSGDIEAQSGAGAGTPPAPSPKPADEAKSIG